MTHNLLLNCLLFMDFGGIKTCDFATQHCFAIYSNSSIRSCNRVYNITTPSTSEITSIKNYFGTIPFSWLVEDADSNTIAILESQGLHHKASFAAMIIDVTQIQPMIYAPGITIQEVSNDDELKTWISIICQSYGYQESEFKKSITYLRHKADNTLQFYIGLFKEKAVGASMIICHTNIISIHKVGVVPEYRGNGVGYAITHACLIDDQKKGYQNAILIASEMAHSIYKKIGFKEYARYKVYGN